MGDVKQAHQAEEIIHVSTYHAVVKSPNIIPGYSILVSLLSKKPHNFIYYIIAFSIFLFVDYLLILIFCCLLLAWKAITLCSIFLYLHKHVST
jgi:hypothetical protein